MPDTVKDFTTVQVKNIALLKVLKGERPLLYGVQEQVYVGDVVKEECCLVQKAQNSKILQLQHQQ